jgi:hypothetical protein
MPKWDNLPTSSVMILKGDNLPTSSVMILKGDNLPTSSVMISVRVLVSRAVDRRFESNQKIIK